MMGGVQCPTSEFSFYVLCFMFFSLSIFLFSGFGLQILIR